MFTAHHVSSPNEICKDGVYKSKSHLIKIIALPKHSILKKLTL
jgi:hypothetical protein